MGFWQTLLAVLVFGTCIGLVARVVVPGTQRIGLILTVFIGIAAAFAGQFIAEYFGWAAETGEAWAELGVFSRGTIEWGKLALQVGIAALFIAALSAARTESR